MIIKKIIPIFALLISSNAFSEYSIKIKLEPNGLNLNLPTEISGEAQLNPSTINRGDLSTISWNYDYATGVEIQGLGTYGKTGSVQVSPLASRNYIINASYGSLSKTENLFLTVIQPDSNISFNSNKNRIGVGQSVLLNWNVSNARDIEIDNGVGFNLPLVSSSEVYPTTDTTFTLSGFDYNDNPIVSSLFIDVVPNTIINSFNASELNITTGESINFNWNVSDSEGLFLSPYGAVSGTPTGSQNITFNTSGAFDFTLESTSLNGTVVSSTPIGINVYDPAIISAYTINGVNTNLDVSPNQSLVFDWSATNAINYTLNGNSINGNTTSLTASSTTGTTNYILSAFNGAGDSVTRSLSVKVVGLPVINTFTGPNTVFANTPLTLSWTGTGVSSYEIKSNNSSSGVSTTANSLGSSNTTNTTPTNAGNYIYTLSAYNTANAKVDLTKSVVVEANPTFTGFTVNGATSINVSPNATLTYAGSGFSNGATLIQRNSSNTATVTNPTTAPTAFGTYTYYAAATKTLNSIIRYSGLRSVIVNVIETWIATTPTYTSWVNSGGIYGCANWSPDPSTVNTGVGFTQTATDCEQNQTRNRQNREQETTTLAIRNSGSVIVENQTLTNQTSTRAATGTKLVQICKYDSRNIASTEAGYTSFLWNNVYIGDSARNSLTLIKGGYKYSRVGGIRKRVDYSTGTECCDGTYFEYEICQEPL